MLENVPFVRTHYFSDREEYEYGVSHPLVSSGVVDARRGSPWVVKVAVPGLSPTDIDITIESSPIERRGFLYIGTSPVKHNVLLVTGHVFLNALKLKLAFDNTELDVKFTCASLSRGVLTVLIPVNRVGCQYKPTTDTVIINKIENERIPQNV